MINGSSSMKMTLIKHLENKEFQELVEIGLNILSSSLTSLREFSLSDLSVINPNLHKMIIFTITDSTENIPNCISMKRKEELVNYIADYVQVIENLNAVLLEEKINEHYTLGLFILSHNISTYESS